MVRFTGIRGAVLFSFIGDLQITYSVRNQFMGKVPREQTEEVLGKHYLLQVREVREEERLIIFSDIDETVENRKRALELIRERLANGEEIYLRGEIVGLQWNAGKEHVAHNVYINVGGLGIIGVIPLSRWSVGYITDYAFIETIQQNIGKRVNFRVDKRTRLSDGRWAYVCNRQAYLEKIGHDPWEIVRKRLCVKDRVVVRLVDNGKGEGYMFGEIDGIPDLNVLCYVARESSLEWKDLKIGSYYYGYVQKMNVEDKFLRIRMTGKAMAGIVLKEAESMDEGPAVLDDSDHGGDEG